MGQQDNYNKGLCPKSLWKNCHYDMGGQEVMFTTALSAEFSFSCDYA